MKRIAHKSFLILSIVIALTIIFTACDSGVTRDTYEYLDKMQVWFEKWDANYYSPWRPYTDSSWDLLLEELASISPPAESIPLMKGSSEQTYLPTDHERLIRVCHHLLSTARHKARMSEIEEYRLRLEGRDYPPACDLCGREPLSQEYCQACRLAEEAYANFSYENATWWLLFRNYLP